MDYSTDGLISDRSILITGAAGFIGSNLAEILSRDNSNSVIMVDDLSKGSRSNLDWAEKRPNCRFHRLDIRDSKSLFELLEDADILLHQAAVASVPASLEDPMGTNDVNVGGTLSCLEGCRRADVGSMVYASSCAVYGEASEPPLSESEPSEPISPYGVSKLSCEQYGLMFSRTYGLRVAGLRYFNVYGPRQDPSSQYAAVVPKFIGRMLKGKPPIIFGDGEQTRDFIYVQDVARANCMAAEKGNQEGSVYNVAGGRPVSINRLVRELNRAMKTDLKPTYGEERPGDIRHSWADLELIKSELDFEPVFSLDEGLQRTVSYFRSRKVK